MAELSAPETTAHACCAPERQVTCCEPSAKAECCGHDEGCGCVAGSMVALPMAPACALDEDGLRLQLVSCVLSSGGKYGMLWYVKNWTAQAGVGVD